MRYHLRLQQILPELNGIFVSILFAVKLRLAYLEQSRYVDREVIEISLQAKDAYWNNHDCNQSEDASNNLRDVPLVGVPQGDTCVTENTDINRREDEQTKVLLLRVSLLTLISFNLIPVDPTQWR